jgi:hypothetical protein
MLKGFHWRVFGHDETGKTVAALFTQNGLRITQKIRF